MKSDKAVPNVASPDGGPEALSIAPEIERILEKLGLDPRREGLLRTPQRVDQALKFLTSGYRTDVAKILNGALYEVKYDEMVVVRDIEFFSMCEHHLLPFFGKCHVGYIPKGRVIGLSKIARIVDVFAKRLQIQENLTKQIADSILRCTGARGVGVVIEAKHLCMMMRGVEKQNSIMKTSCMLGVFRSQISTRSEFLSLIQ